MSKILHLNCEDLTIDATDFYPDSKRRGITIEDLESDSIVALYVALQEEAETRGLIGSTEIVDDVLTPTVDHQHIGEGVALEFEESNDELVCTGPRHQATELRIAGTQAIVCLATAPGVSDAIRLEAARYLMENAATMEAWTAPAPVVEKKGGLPVITALILAAQIEWTCTEDPTNGALMQGTLTLEDGSKLGSSYRLYDNEGNPSDRHLRAACEYALITGYTEGK